MNGLTIPPNAASPSNWSLKASTATNGYNGKTQIELTNNPDYLGSWESRGYPNNATLR